jgi:hypothetical protein
MRGECKTLFMRLRRRGNSIVLPYCKAGNVFTHGRIALGICMIIS